MKHLSLKEAKIVKSETYTQSSQACAENNNEKQKSEGIWQQFSYCLDNERT